MCLFAAFWLVQQNLGLVYAHCSICNRNGRKRLILIFFMDAMTSTNMNVSTHHCQLYTHQFYTKSFLLLLLLFFSVYRNFYAFYYKKSNKQTNLPSCRTISTIKMKRSVMVILNRTIAAYTSYCIQPYTVPTHTNIARQKLWQISGSCTRKIINITKTR